MLPEKPFHARLLARSVVLASVLAAATGLAACGDGANAASGGSGEVTEIRYQGSVGQVNFPELAENLGYLGKLKLKWVGNTISGPQDIQSVATGAIDIGGAFNGAIVKLVSAGAPIEAVVGYYGTDDKSYQGFYALDGTSIKGPRDFIGKKVGMNALGAHAEAVLDEYLKRGGLTPAEIKKVIPTVVPPVNAEQALRARQIDVAVLGSVIRDKAVARGGLTKVTSDYDLLGKFTAGSLVVRKDFAAKNPATTKTLVTGIAKAIEWSQTQPRDVVVAKFKQIIATRGRHEDTTLADLWKSSGVAGKGGVITDGEITVWIDWLRSNGQLSKNVSAKDVYTNQFNGLAGS